MLNRIEIEPIFSKILDKITGKNTKEYKQNTFLLKRFFDKELKKCEESISKTMHVNFPDLKSRIKTNSMTYTVTTERNLEGDKVESRRHDPCRRVRADWLRQILKTGLWKGDFLRFVINFA